MATWPLIIDDDGTGTSGTTLDVALFNAIKAYIDGAAAWQPAAVGVVTDDVGAVLTTSIVFSRTVRLSPTSLVWAFRSDLFTLPTASANIWLSYLPFTCSNTNQRNAVAWTSIPGLYLRVYGADGTRFQLAKADGTNIAPGSYFAAFTSVWEVA